MIFFQGFVWSRVPEPTTFGPWVAFQFSHVNITMTDCVMAMLFKKKISVIQYFFMFRICFDLFVLNFRNVRLKYVNV